MGSDEAMAERDLSAVDIYALGCLVYEMLSGEPPFTRSSPQATLVGRSSGCGRKWQKGSKAVFGALAKR